MDVPLPSDLKALSRSLRRAKRNKEVLVPYRTLQDGLQHARIDPIDSHLLRYTWREASGGYVKRSGRRRVDGEWRTFSSYLHKEIAGLRAGDRRFEVHHANHDILDCRRVNLWLCTPRFNLRHQRRSSRSMLQEIWSVPPERVECWPLGDRKRAILHLVELHREKHGSYPLELHPPSLLQKVRPVPKVFQ